MKSIKQFIQTHVDADFQAEDTLPFICHQKAIPKNTLITRYGQTERYAYFLLSGIVKISMLRDDGQERVLEFFFPGSFFSAYTSFLTAEAADVEIEALCDCEVEMISHSDMQQAYKHSLLANKLGRIVAEHYYIRKTNREKDFLTKSATERYTELLTRRPEQQIPVQLTARYLGIEPESLSRIRKMIS